MLKMGWRPGHSLGVRNDGILRPIVAKGQLDKKGLGYDSDYSVEPVVNILKSNSNMCRPSFSIGEMVCENVFEED